ncbi:MAG: sigma-70 family RNA polymerase sigma factor [Acidobacteriota bacterium]|nr:sigma-70 family RNA polymerase sigma factor [Acidobacteriota bacterium]
MSERERKKRRQTAEAELVAEIASGSSEALAALYERYAGMLLGLANTVLHDRGEAEEVLQETLLQVWKQASRYDAGRSSVSTWLVLITRSRAIDRLRNRKVVRKTVTAAQHERHATYASPEGMSNVFMLERRRRLSDELNRLPREQRRVLEMAFFEGLTQHEIADRTGTPLGTVKTRTLLAMKKLRQALANEIEDLL